MQNIIKVTASISSGTTGIFGCIDAIEEHGIEGWLHDCSRDLSGSILECCLDEQVIASGEIMFYRKDISDILERVAYCGFKLKWKTAVDLKRWTRAELGNLLFRLGGENLCLPFPVDDAFALESEVVASAPETEVVESMTTPEIEESKPELEVVASLPEAEAKPIASKPTPLELKEKFEEVIGLEEPLARAQGDVKLIAYYLPQFHPIPENDAWWGPGFTEWRNVTQAKAYFTGHQQPRVPGALGYYDLRLPETREAQAAMARKYGIYGFCYYYYWFQGRRLLERPLREVLDSGKPDFPFCICWANETWSRRWDGSENDILIQQVHDEKTDMDFINDVIPLFNDKRYITINNAPLLLIYRISLLPDPKATAERWRTVCREQGIGEIHLCMVESFGLNDPYQYGFDSSACFPPHGTNTKAVNADIPDLPEDFTGMIYSYDDMATYEICKERPGYRNFPGVMTSWDNTARKQKAGNIFFGASPDSYEIWLRAAIDSVRENLPQEERFVFINAWNEWAEGAYLEPDATFGYAWLEATLRALTGQSDWKQLLRYAESLPEIHGAQKDRLLHDLRYILTRNEKMSVYWNELLGKYGLPKTWTLMKSGLPHSLQGIPMERNGLGSLDQCNHYQKPKFLRSDRCQKLYISGWAFSLFDSLDKTAPGYVALLNASQEIQYYAFITDRLIREDVVTAFPAISAACVRYCGFKQAIDISDVDNGRYTFAFVTRYPAKAVMSIFDSEVEIA
jgi:hypothetical protein